jgi:hypothetical protein
MNIKIQQDPESIIYASSLDVGDVFETPDGNVFIRGDYCLIPLKDGDNGINLLQPILGDNSSLFYSIIASRVLGKLVVEE